MKMAKKIKVTRDVIESLTWRQLPEDGGQLVSVTYAVDQDYVYRQEYDRSTRSSSYTAARLYARATEDELAFEPQNGRLPRHNAWREAVVIG
jgi:hypothetical protein